MWIQHLGLHYCCILLTQIIFLIIYKIQGYKAGHQSILICHRRLIPYQLFQMLIICVVKITDEKTKNYFARLNNIFFLIYKKKFFYSLYFNVYVLIVENQAFFSCSTPKQVFGINWGLLLFTSSLSEDLYQLDCKVLRGGKQLNPCRSDE